MLACHICSGHSVDDTRVFYRECQGLVANGYQVHLIGHGSESRTYDREGVRITSLKPARSRARRILRRRQVARMAAELQPDLFHVHEPELLGPVIRVAQGRPVVWDVHEAYHELIREKTWIPRPIRSLVATTWDRYERRALKQCSAVICVTEGIALRYRALGCATTVVANYAPQRMASEKPRCASPGRLVFAGGITPIRGLTETIQAIGILKQQGLEIDFDLAGPPRPVEFLDELFALAKKCGVLRQIHYHGQLSKQDVEALYGSASIGIIPYQPTHNNTIGLATKLVECMAHGLPIVYSNFPTYRTVAGGTAAGLPVDPTDPSAIAEALKQLAEDEPLRRRLGAGGRERVTSKFCWETQLAALLKVYENLLDKPRIRRAA